MTAGGWTLLGLIVAFALWSMFFSQRKDEARKFWLSTVLVIALFFALVAGIGALVYFI